MIDENTVHYCDGIRCVGFNPFKPITTDNILTDDECWDVLVDVIERNRDKTITGSLMKKSFMWATLGRSNGNNLKLDLLRKVWFKKDVDSITFDFEDADGNQNQLYLAKGSYLLPLTESLIKNFGGLK